MSQLDSETNKKNHCIHKRFLFVQIFGLPMSQWQLANTHSRKIKFQLAILLNLENFKLWVVGKKQMCLFDRAYKINL